MKAFLVLIFFGVVWSCTLQTNYKKQDAKMVVTDWLGREFSLPDSVYLLKGDSLTDISDNPFIPAASKIITFISGDCEKCIHEMQKWQLLLDSLNQFARVDFIPVIFTTDLNNFLTIYRKADQPEFEIYVDTEFKFLLQFNLPEEWKFRTFLLDENNRIILVGNPLYYPKIKSLMITKLTE